MGAVVVLLMELSSDVFNPEQSRHPSLSGIYSEIKLNLPHDLDYGELADMV